MTTHSKPLPNRPYPNKAWISGDTLYCTDRAVMFMFGTFTAVERLHGERRAREAMLRSLGLSDRQIRDRKDRTTEIVIDCEECQEEHRVCTIDPESTCIS